MPTFHHVHGPNDPCGPGCPGYYSDDDSAWKAYNKEVNQQQPPTGFNPSAWYPNVPLTSNEKAFLWVANNGHEKGGTVVEDTSHWRIIDSISKKNIYDFLQDSQKIELPMLWGYVVFLPDNKMYVKFLTHINPGKQDLEYIPEALPDIEDKFNRKMVDYDIEDTHTPILESYTPQNVETTGYQGKKPLMPEPEEIMPEPENLTGEFKDIKQDLLESGIRISTMFLGEMAPDPHNPFENFVYDKNDQTGKSLEVHYTDNEASALNTHYALVDKYNKLAIEKQDKDQQVQSRQAHIMVTSHFNDAGILATEVHPDQMRLLPKTHDVHAVEITPDEEASHEDGERPFMWHEPSNTLFYTTRECHHMNIIPQINQYLMEHGQNYNGPWVTGDITSPEHTGRNWIKFLGTDTGHYPKSVINYMQQKFGPNRDLMYSGYDGWEDLPEELIQKG